MFLIDGLAVPKCDQLGQFWWHNWGPRGRTLRRLEHRDQSPVRYSGEYLTPRGRRQWSYAIYTLNIQEFQLYSLHTKDNERKTQGKGKFIFLFFLNCQLSLPFSGLFLCSKRPFRTPLKGLFTFH